MNSNYLKFTEEYLKLLRSSFNGTDAVHISKHGRTEIKIEDFELFHRVDVQPDEDSAAKPSVKVISNSGVRYDLETIFFL